MFHKADFVPVQYLLYIKDTPKALKSTRAKLTDATLLLAKADSAFEVTKNLQRAADKFAT